MPVKADSSTLKTFKRHFKSLTELKMKDFKMSERTIMGRRGYAVELTAPMEVDDIMGLFNRGDGAKAMKLAKSVLFLWVEGDEVKIA